MRAIILAAGIGNRLGDIAGGKPKCLLQFAGKSLLHRHVATLTKLGINDILVVTGYRQDDIIAELDSLKFAAGINTIFNPDYKSGSVISLLNARSFLDSGEDIILMDADVLYHADIMHTLVHTPVANCFLLDREFEAGDEPVKICVRGNIIVDFRKKIAGRLVFDYQGESVGFFRFSGNLGKKLAMQCRRYVDNNQQDAPYEEAIRDLLLQTPDAFGFEDISGLPWIEIDFPEDVNRATYEVLNKII